MVCQNIKYLRNYWSQNDKITTKLLEIKRSIILSSSLPTTITRNIFYFKCKSGSFCYKKVPMADLEGLVGEIIIIICVFHKLIKRKVLYIYNKNTYQHTKLLPFLVSHFLNYCVLWKLHWQLLYLRPQGMQVFFLTSCLFCYE